MKRQKVIFSLVALAMIAGTGLLLAFVPQKLGQPGVKTTPIAGSRKCDIYLPEQVLGCVSTNEDLDTNSAAMLPADTSYAGRIYFRGGRPVVESDVVLMGSDRTSIHNAEYCLSGQGMHIDQLTESSIHMDQPLSYDLPIIKIIATRSGTLNGKPVTQRCVYVYWYVTDDALSNDHTGHQLMWSMTRQLIRTGVLQRWAYVRFFTFCEPGREDEAFDEIKRMIAASVPQFQLTPKPADTTMAAQH
jgi:hypothetical protein